MLTTLLGREPKNNPKAEIKNDDRYFYRQFIYIIQTSIMKRITLLGINARYTHSNLALYYIRESISDLAYNIVQIEESINQDKFKILAEVVASKADVLAISTYIWNRDIVEFLLTSLKQIKPSIRIVLGGPEAGYNPTFWLEREYPPDFIIIGGGEAGWRYLAENDFQVEEKIINRLNHSFTKIKLPYKKEDFPALVNKYIYYEASRGCPFRCSFCLSSRIDQKLEYKSIEVIKNEIKIILAHNPKIIKFVDRSFNVDSSISQAVWTYINSLDTQTKFHFEVHPSLFKSKDFQILEATPKDRIQFEIGVQSTNPQTITEINRNHHFNDYKDKLQQLLQIKNIHSHLDLIIGLPYENRDSVLDSLNDLLLLEPDVIQLGFLKVLPGTEMYDKKEEYQLIYDSQAPYQILQTKWLSFDDLSYLLAFEEIFNLIHNTNRLQNTIEYLTSFFQRPVDFFQHLLEYRQDKLDLSNSNWTQIFASIRDFIAQTKESLDLEVLDDYLSWDWLLHSRKNNLPSFLDKEANHSFKREVFLDIKNNEGEVWEKLLGPNIKNLNNCAFFIPQSREFCDRVFGGKRRALLFSHEIFLI